VPSGTSVIVLSKTGAVAMRKFKAANISEYEGRPLRLQRHGNRSFACDQCHATSLSGIYGPIDGQDLWVCAACMECILESRYSKRRAKARRTILGPVQANRNGVVEQGSKAESEGLDAVEA
jgi:hypothetical protein